MEPTGIDWWTLLFAVAATAAAVVAALWAWIDRPRRFWWYRFKPTADWKPREGGGETLTLDKVAVEVRATGAPMHSAALRVQGCKVVSNKEDQVLNMALLTVGSDPLKVEVQLDHERKDEGAYIELTWIRPRPLQQQGTRFNLWTGEQEVWRWGWLSLRIRKRGDGPWWKVWKYRLIRTCGRWVAWVGVPLATIPESASK